MPDGSFKVNANIKAAGTSPRAVHKFVSGVNDGVDTSKVRPSDWNFEHLLIGMPTRIKAVDFILASLATKTWSDSEVARRGAMLIYAESDGIGICQYYREGTFNTVTGIQFGNFVFRGTTFSAGGNNTGFHFYISSNSTGATLNLKNTQSYQRQFVVFEWLSLVGSGNVQSGLITP